jgi:hypothetical protein
MSFRSDTYRILIASPSDLSEERQAATEAINDWNAQNSAAESVVLLPVKWETHAMPQTGIRPQEAINRQLARKCDLLVGLFWTKLGTSTGVAESGTVEEIDQFLRVGKPAMLYVSSRPVDPNKIDLKQHRKLKAFTQRTYKKALVGGFSSVPELRMILLRNIGQQVRLWKARQGGSGTGGLTRIEEAAKVTDIIVQHRRHRISPELYRQYCEELLGVSKSRKKPDKETDEKGPNGGKVEYLPNGDKIEWVEDVDEDGKPSRFPIILRRNDESIHQAEQEFFDKVWWNRHYIYDLRKFTPEQRKLWKRAEKHAKEITKRYGLEELEMDTFTWGMVNGKLSALRWVLGADWDMLDT